MNSFEEKRQAACRVFREADLGPIELRIVKLYSSNIDNLILETIARKREALERYLANLEAAEGDH